MKYVTRAIRRARVRLERAARRLRRGWRQHRERMSGESGYAEEFEAVVLAAVKLTCQSHPVRRLVREVVAAYAAVPRAQRPHSGGVHA